MIKLNININLFNKETTGRARGRVNKHDESNENISTQSNAKKRMSIESKYKNIYLNI